MQMLVKEVHVDAAPLAVTDQRLPVMGASCCAAPDVPWRRAQQVEIDLRVKRV